MNGTRAAQLTLSLCRHLGKDVTLIGAFALVTGGGLFKPLRSTTVGF